MVFHDGLGTHHEEAEKTTYKLTSEALGSGIQILTDLTGIAAGNMYQLRMHGPLEMFQRRMAPRVDISAEIFHLHGNFPLATFKRKWKQVRDQLSKDHVLPGLILQETKINLSVGGVGYMADSTNRPTPFSMFFIALDESGPVCALTETVWDRHEGKGLRCGFRFIHILKTDQELISSYLGRLIRESGGSYQDYKRNWVLVDKMGTDALKPV
jgi:hypothetical protein